MTHMPIDALEKLLAEDVPYGDLTTDALGIGNERGRISFAARNAMVVAAIEEVNAILGLAEVDATVKVRSGDAVEPGTVLLMGEGSARALHRAWKVAQPWSKPGRASRPLHGCWFRPPARSGRILQSRARERMCQARKALSIAAVRAGGAVAHRLGLSETILVFPEHRVSAPIPISPSWFASCGRMRVKRSS